ncbi:MAG: sulfatase [Planctomycetota bacterium]|jgi:arylsulfatase A-like enzyme
MFKRLVVCVLLMAATVARGADRPNVLFISVDDMNDWIGCLGSDRVATPNIDALAARGVLFTNAHAPAPKCGPSRATILLGRRAPVTGLYSNGHWWRPAYPDAVTLPRYFKDHGYHVAGGGKVHHHTDGFNPPDQWDEYSPLLDDKNLVQDMLRKQGRQYLTDRMPRHPNGSLDWGPVPLDDTQMGDGRTLRFAEEFLRRKHDKPFFLAVGLFQPHLPFYAPQHHYDAISEHDARPPINKPGDLDDVPSGGHKMAEYRRNDLRMIEEHDSLENCVRSYLASIRHADALIGRLMKAFDASAYARNTIVVLWSDHGYHFGEKDHYAKNTLWERSTHVPLIVAAPGVTQPNRRCDRPVDLAALYPTLVNLCGLPARDDSRATARCAPSAGVTSATRPGARSCTTIRWTRTSGATSRPTRDTRRSCRTCAAGWRRTGWRKFRRRARTSSMSSRTPGARRQRAR